ncbi:MAG: DEAD/DEAH box helicase [Candidatus Peribacteraceae bacterium]
MTHPIPSSFESLGLSPEVLKLLTAKGITIPTPIQHSAIPPALKGNDVIGIAQTGTGKTLAFGIPLLESLHKGKKRALIVLPTRELALQVEESLMQFARSFGIGMAVFIGGASMYRQRMMLKSNPRILIATPGRLIDHLEQRTVTLKEVEILVLDEADRMLDMGFAPQIQKIFKAIPENRQTLLFSATMPSAITTIAMKHMRTPLRVEVAPSGSTAAGVEQHALIVSKDQKTTMLVSLLGETEGSVIVFSRTKHGAKKLTASLIASGISAAEIHSDKSLAQRKAALSGFKNRKYKVLVATDIAARGIDVIGIELVVNYDLPMNPEDYVHRIGRTGRAGKEGQAMSFVTPDQMSDLRAIERLIKKSLNVSEHPSAAGASRRSESPHHRSGGGNRRGGGGGGRFRGPPRRR